jgi:uncharacterized protein (DUF1800 family)
MQLVSIGLVELNTTARSLVNGNPVDTYGMDDIRGLARVFTGWAGATPVRRILPMAGSPAATRKTRCAA